MTGGVLMSKSSLLRLFRSFLFSSGGNGARPYPCLSSIGEDLEAHKAFAGNELGK